MMSVGIDGVALRLRHLLDAADLDLVAGREVEGAARRCLRPRCGPRPGLAHDAVGAAVGLVDDHALREQAGERLVEAEVAGHLHGAGEEARIEEMQDRVLDAADVLVDRQPVIGGALVGRRRGMRRGEAGEVPGRVDEGVHGVGLADRRLAADRAGDVLPRRVAVERVAGLVEGDVVGQPHRQVVRPAPARRRARGNG